MICSCFRLQCPTLPALFSFTHQRKSCWKDLLCPSSMVLLEHPAHHGHAVLVWPLWWALGQLWAVPSVPGPFTVPVHKSQQLHQRNKGEQGKEKKLEEAYSLLFSLFRPPPLREAVEKETSYWLSSHPGESSYPYSKTLMGKIIPPAPACKGRVHFLSPGCWALGSLKQCFCSEEQWRGARVYSSYQTS